MRHHWLMALATTALLVSCHTTKNTEAGNDTSSGKKTNTESMAYTLTGTHWKVIEINGQAVSNPAGKQKEAFIMLSTDNKIQGNGGCNTLMGSYTLMEGNRIKFSGVASTMMACPDMTIETQLGKALESCDNYSIQGNHLSLNKAKMAPLVRFEAQ